ncbi:MAG: hypothetical protein HZB09_01515 [Candidatus Yonathbacteria bacterium]|nr:hypothetical protein [Candidatus Yonathbacteria bacterium]
MENVQFNPQDKDFQNLNVAPTSSKSKMVRWIVKYSGGLVKDETRANYVLLGIAGIFFILTIASIISATDIGPKKTTYKEDIPPEVKAMMPPEVYNSLPSRNK